MIWYLPKEFTFIALEKCFFEIYKKRSLNELSLNDISYPKCYQNALQKTMWYRYALLSYVTYDLRDDKFLKQHRVSNLIKSFSFIKIWTHYKHDHLIDLRSGGILSVLLCLRSRVRSPLLSKSSCFDWKSIIISNSWLNFYCYSTKFAHRTRFRNNWMSDCEPPGNNRQTA